MSVSNRPQGFPASKARDRGASLTGYGLIVGLISIVALVAVTGTGSSVKELFVETGDTLGSVISEATPQASVTDPNTTPDAFDFADQTNVTTSSQIESAILEITGISEPVDVSVSGDGSPEFRVCGDSGCSSELTTWSSSTSQINAGEYLQVRTTSPSGATTSGTVSVSVGLGSDDWTITTGLVLYGFTTHTFTSCGITAGKFGPSESQCETAYASTDWEDNNSFFSVTNGIQSWTVPETATYEFVITAPSLHWSIGEGSIITATVDLTQGEVVNIVVGQRGLGSYPVTEGTTVNSNDGLGGAGGTFVYTGAIGGSGLIGAAGGGNINCTPTNLTSCPGHSNAGQHGALLFTSSIRSAPGAGWLSTQGKDANNVQGGQHFVGGNESDCGYQSCADQPGGFGGGGGSGNDNIGGSGGYTGGANTANNDYSTLGYAGGSSPQSATRSTTVVFTGAHLGTGSVVVTKQ